MIITVTGPVRSIRGLSLDTGSYRVSEGGWIQGGNDAPLSYGHGLVTDDVIVWDERCTAHFAVRDPWPGRRVLHRVLVEGDRPQHAG